MKIISEMCINSWACLVGLSFYDPNRCIMIYALLGTKFLRIVSCRLPSECVFSSALMDVIMTLVVQTIYHFVLALLWHICQCINQAYLWIIHMNIFWCGLHFCLLIMLRGSTKVFTFLSKMTIYIYDAIKQIMNSRCCSPQSPYSVQGGALKVRTQSLFSGV